MPIRGSSSSSSSSASATIPAASLVTQGSSTSSVNNVLSESSILDAPVVIHDRKMEAVYAQAVLVLSVFFSPFLCLGDVQITTLRQNAQDLKEHGSLTLECRSTDSSHAEWTHNGHPVSNTTGRFIVVEEKTSPGGLLSSLTIVSAEPEDAGTYVCACPHTNSGDSINVTVTGHEHHSQVMIDGPTEVDKTIGSELRLTCKADIHTSFEWFLNGVKLAESTENAMTTKEDEKSHQKTVLLVRKILSAHDFGVYSCRSVRDMKDEARVAVKYDSSSSASGLPRYAMETTGLVLPMVIGMLIATTQ